MSFQLMERKVSTGGRKRVRVCQSDRGQKRIHGLNPRNVAKYKRPPRFLLEKAHVNEP